MPINPFKDQCPSNKTTGSGINQCHLLEQDPKLLNVSLSITRLCDISSENPKGDLKAGKSCAYRAVSRTRLLIQSHLVIPAL